MIGKKAHAWVEAYFKGVNDSRRFEMHFYERLYFGEKKELKLKNDEALSDYAKRIVEIRSGAFERAYRL